MKIALVTDAWTPQTNGVVTTLKQVIAQVEARGHGVRVFEPGQFFTLPLPAYREVKVAPLPYGLGRALDAYGFDALHIATEGPWALLPGAGLCAGVCRLPPPCILSFLSTS